jgi:hypothetical protein
VRCSETEVESPRLLFIVLLQTAAGFGKDAYSSTIRLLLSAGRRRSFVSEMLGEQRNVIHLQSPVSVHGRVRRECRVCKEPYWERLPRDEAGLTTLKSKKRNGSVRIDVGKSAYH